MISVYIWFVSSLELLQMIQKKASLHTDIGVYVHRFLKVSNLWVIE